MVTLKQKYEKQILKKLEKQFGYQNHWQVPKIDKIVINRGITEATQNPKAVDVSVEEIAQITGQRPLVTKAKKSIAAFKLQANKPNGCKVTLRGKRMYHFLDKLINICLPKIRDFRGINPKAFDGRGNYTLGIKEQLIFPEIEYDSVDQVRGMDITLVTTANTDEEAKALMKELGFPFRK